jgi:hypothetical protein
MPQPARQVIEMAKRGQPFNIAFPRGCSEKQRWLNSLDLAVSLFFVQRDVRQSRSLMVRWRTTPSMERRGSKTGQH